MRFVALTIAAIALAVGAFQFAGSSDRASAGVDIVRGDLCGIEAEAQPTGGDDLTIFEPYIDASEGDLFGGFIQVVIIPNGPGGRVNVHCQFDLVELERLAETPKRAVSTSFICGGPAFPATRGRAVLTPTGILNVNCHWDTLPPPPPAP